MSKLKTPGYIDPKGKSPCPENAQVLLFVIFPELSHGSHHRILVLNVEECSSTVGRSLTSVRQEAPGLGFRIHKLVKITRQRIYALDWIPWL